MGKSYKGIRRKFGAQGSKEHFDRSKWTGSNGTRLRSLSADLVNYEDAAKELEEERRYSEPLSTLVLAQSTVLMTPNYSVFPMENLNSKRNYAHRRIDHLLKTIDHIYTSQGVCGYEKVRANDVYTSLLREWRKKLGDILLEIKRRNPPKVPEERVKMTEERMRELLAKGREVRLIVEKDIAEMQYIPPELANGRCR